MSATPNRFDLLRLVFASVVFVYHGTVLPALDIGGRAEIWLGGLAEMSIQGFFIVSGALVFGSLERSASVRDYAGKRVRRLYQAYAVVVLVPALVSLVLSWGGQGALGQIGQYLAANLVFLNFLEPNLPGLFAGQRFGEVNGALWTLKIEVMFYLALPVLAWGLGKLGRHWWLGIAALYIGGTAWAMLVPTWEHALSAQVARQLPGQMAFFASGMGLWRLWDRAKTQPWLFGAVGLGLLVLSWLHPMVEPLRAAGLAGLIGWAAFAPGLMLNAARWGDVSYGVYITHFPVVQALVTAGLFTAIGAIGGLALAGAVVLGLSFALWWLVEKPALRKDSHYRKVSETGALNG